MMWRTFTQLALADWRERVRRHSFLVVMLVTVWFGWVALPPNHSIYATLQIDGTRGIYNSAWVGSVVAVLTSLFLSVAGFYVVKNTVERDRRTGVGEILATTPISKIVYTLGKTASNFVVLGSVVLVVMLTAAVMQLARGEDPHLDLLDLAAPFVLVTLPAMAIVAAAAVLFETVPGLRSGAGNALWVFFAMVVLWGPSISGVERGQPGNDPMGTAIIHDIRRAQAQAFPHANPDRFSMGFTFRKSGTWDLQLFRWKGPNWSMGRIAGRLLWFAVAIAIAMAAAIPFDRFEAGKARQATKKTRARTQAPKPGVEKRAPAPSSPVVHHLGARPAVRERAGFTPLLRAELLLSLRGRPTAWWLVALGLFLGEWFSPIYVARAWVLPFAWIWPLLVWSDLGGREQRYQTVSLIFISPRPVVRPALATWVVGILVAIAAGLPVGVRLAVSWDFAGLAAWSSGALFIPAFALAAGTWTGGGKLFEGLYTFLWYAGPLQHVPLFDFAGSTAESVATGAWVGYGVAAAVLFGTALLGRRRLMM